MKRRILVIDGMYFANRTLFGMQAENDNLTLETEQEQHNLMSNLHNSMMSLINIFNAKNDLIHNVLIVEDFGSWRKSMKPYIPYYYQRLQENNEEIPVLGYKENRVAKKESSQINYDNFNGVVHKFFDDINSKIPVLKIYGCEGDDLILLLSKTFRDNENYELLVFCTDGDLVQTVNDNCMLFRNIKSKECPNGEFVVSPNMLKKYAIENDDTSKTSADRLLGSNIKTNDYNELFSFSMNGLSVKRTIGQDIRYASPVTISMIKTICGDAKDNIFPILRIPKSSSRSKNLSVSEKQLISSIEKVFSSELNEKISFEVMTNKETREKIFMNLRSSFKDSEYPLEKMEEHFQHNFKINVLSLKNLSSEIIDKYKTEIKEIFPRVAKKIDMSLFDINKAKTIRDDATDLLAKSAPKELI